MLIGRRLLALLILLSLQPLGLALGANVRNGNETSPALFGLFSRLEDYFEIKPAFPAIPPLQGGACGSTNGEVYAMPACAVAPGGNLVNRALLTSISPQVITVQPGQSISFALRYQIWQGTNSQEIDQVMFIASWTPSWPPSSSYYWGTYSAIPPSYPGITGSAYFSLNAPSNPGIYYLWFVFDANYGYAQAANDFRIPLVAPPAHIKIVVSAGPFDFSISVSPNSGSVVAGKALVPAGTVTLTLASGSSQSVSLSLSGLPSNVGTEDLTGKSCSPTCSISFGIGTYSSAPPRTYTLTITGAGGGRTHSTPYTLTVTPPPTTCGATSGGLYVLPACAISPGGSLVDRALLTSVLGGQTITAQPGQSISFTVGYQIWQGANPSEIDQLMFIPSWTSSWPPSPGYYFGIYSAIPPSPPGTSGFASFSITVPLTQGTYYLWFVFDANYGFDQAALDFQRQLIAPPAHITIVVSGTSTVTLYTTTATTSTITQTSWTTTTIQTQGGIITFFTTVSVIVPRTVIANPVWTTTTIMGITTTTIYSPTVTVTVVAQTFFALFALVSEFLPLGISLLLLSQRKSVSLITALRRSGLFGYWLLKKTNSHKFRKGVLASTLIVLSLMPVLSPALKSAYADAVTVTRTETLTQFSTVIQSLTSTVFSGSSTSTTATLTQTISPAITITPTITSTVFNGATKTVYLPTTTYSTQRAMRVTIEITLFDANCHTVISRIWKGDPYCIQILVKNPSTTTADIQVQRNLHFDGDPNQNVGIGGIPAEPWKLNPRFEFADDRIFTLTPGAQQKFYTYPHFNWDWLPPLTLPNVAKDTYLTIVFAVIDAILKLLGFPDLLSFLYGTKTQTELITNLLQGLLSQTWSASWVYDVTARVVQTGQTTSASQTIRAFVSPMAALAIVSAIAAGMIGGAVALIAFALTCPETGCSLAIFGAMVLAAVVGQVMWLLGQQLYLAATDPEDDYDQIPTVQFALPPTVEKLPDGPEKSLAINAIHVLSFMRAYSKAMARYYSAVEHTSLDAALRQLSAGSGFLSQARSEMLKVKDGFALVTQRLPPLDPVAVNQAKINLESGKFPEQFQTLSDELGTNRFREQMLSLVQNKSAIFPSIEVSKAIEGFSNYIEKQQNFVQNGITMLQKPDALTGLTEFFSDTVWLTRISIALALVSVVAVLISVRSRRYAAERLRVLVSSSCVNCGAYLQLGTKYCRVCGQVVKSKPRISS